MATTYLTRTFGTATNRKKFTLSMWVKQSGRGTGNNNSLLVSGASGQNEGTIKISSDAILWNEYNVGNATSEGILVSNQLLRDYSGWYHLVFAWDSTNATADDRMKIYLNGEQVTSFSSRTNPSLNYDAQINNNIVHNIGRQTWNSSGLFDGSMSHINFVDGTAELPTAFGEYDANGVWTLKASPSVTYGTNGFFILKDGNSVTDQSPNTNNFTVAGGTLTNTEDNPSNIFATLNSIGIVYGHTYTGTFSNGNLSYVTGGNSSIAFSTIETVSSSSNGFYYEIKCGTLDSVRTYIGLIDPSYSSTSSNGGLQNFNEKAVINSNGQYYNTANGTAVVATYTSFLENDIIMVAYKNGSIWFGKNGTWMNSGNPSTGANAIDTNINTDRTWLPAFGYNSNFNVNFGNGYFGTTAVSSAGTNASGIGIFEYDVPTGYTALSTKGLNL